MKYKPFRDLILVKKIEDNTLIGDLIMPDKRRQQFIKLEVIATGPDVSIVLKKGDIVHAENMYQPLDKEQGLILDQYVFAREEENESN